MTDLGARSSAVARIAARIDPAVRLVSSPLSGTLSDLLPEERSMVTNAVPKRVREVATGRSLARRVLHELGAPDGPLGRHADRMPMWPEGFVGSISHCDSLCLVLAARAGDVRALGVDVEANTPLERNLFSLVLTRAERERLEVHPEHERGSIAKLVFSAKECFYKCQYMHTRTMLDFQDVELTLDLDARVYRAEVTHSGVRARLEAEGAHPATGLFEVDDAFIVSAMAVTRSRTA